MPNADGIFENIPDVLAWVWSQDTWLAGLVPDEEVHRYGVEHIADADLIARTAAYVVINDLTESAVIRGLAQTGSWPHRVMIYARKQDGVIMAQNMREKFIENLKANGRRQTRCGTICRLDVTGRRLGQSLNHYFAQFTVQPTIKG